MFRNKILVRANPPSPPSTSPFLLLQFHLHPPCSSPRPSADPSLFVKLEALCWKLSRAWRVACLCFPPSPDVALVYQRSQSPSVDQVVKELVEQFPVHDVGPEEEVASGSLVAKAVECALRCAFLDSGWRCLGNSLFVDSDFSPGDERSYLCALDVRVQPEMDDGFIFLVSPDVVRFSRYKIADLLSSILEPNFYSGQEVILEDHNSGNPCYVLPYLYEAYVIGLGKVLPAWENLGEFEDLWSSKHGIALQNDYFTRIQFTFGGQASQKWLPSAFVLRGSGLASAPQTTRVMKATSALDSFMKLVEGWNFFGQGRPIVQVVSSLNIGSELFTWTKAADAVDMFASRYTTNTSGIEITRTKASIPTNLLSVNDFRTPKPAGCIIGYRKLENTASLEDIIKSTGTIFVNDSSTHVQDVPPSVSTAKLRPLFGGNIASKKRIPLGDGVALSTKVGNIVGKSCLLSGSLRKSTGTGTEKRQTSAEEFVNDASKDSEENARKDKSMLQIKSRNSQDKQKSKLILGNSSLTSPTEVALAEVSSKQATNKRKKIRLYLFFQAIYRHGDSLFDYAISIVKQLIMEAFVLLSFKMYYITF